MNGCMDGCITGCMVGCMDRCIDGCMDRWMDAWMNDTQLHRASLSDSHKKQLRGFSCLPSRLATPPPPPATPLPTTTPSRTMPWNTSGHSSFHPFISLFILYLSIHIFTYASIYPFTQQSILLSIHLSIHQSFNLSIHSSIHPSIHHSECPASARCREPLPRESCGSTPNNPFISLSSGRCVRVCVCLPVYVCGYVCVFLCVGVCFCVWVYVFVCGCMFLCVGVCFCVWVCVFVCGCMFLCVGVCFCVWVYVFVCGCVCVRGPQSSSHSNHNPQVAEKPDLVPLALQAFVNILCGDFKNNKTLPLLL